MVFIIKNARFFDDFCNQKGKNSQTILEFFIAKRAKKINFFRNELLFLAPTKQLPLQLHYKLDERGMF